MKRQDIYWLALLAFIITWAVSSLWWPFGPDQGIFAWVGDVILKGGMPYQDAWEVKGPAVHYLYALVQYLLGRTMWGIRLLDLGLLALALIFLWQLARKLYNDTAAKLAVALFALWYAGSGYWSTAQPDGWAAMVLVIVVTLLLAENSGPRKALAAGALIGFCTLMKPLYAIYLTLFVVYAAFCWWHTHLSRRDLIRSIALATLTCAVTVILMIIWFVHKGALDNLFEIQIVFNSTVHRLAHTRSLPEQMLFVLGFMLQLWILVALWPATVGAIVLWQRMRPAAAVILAWALLSLIIVIIQDKFYLHHWLPLYAPLALVTGGGLSRLLAGKLSTFANGKRKYLALVSSPWVTRSVLVLIFGLAMLSPTHSLLRWTLRLNGYEDWNSYYKGFGTYGEGDFSFKADQEVAQYVAQRSTPQDRVLVWGFDVLVNYLSGRPSPSRFGFNYALVRGPQNNLETAYRAEFMQALQADPPLYILILDKDKNDLMQKTSRQFVSDFPEFEAYLNQHYRLETTIEHFAVWRSHPLEKAAK